MEYQVRHRTVYRYLQDVSNSCHLAHLVPRQTNAQRVRTARLSVTPLPNRRHRHEDFFGNVIEWFSIDQPHSVLEILSECRVDVADPRALRPEESMPWEKVCAALETESDAEWRDAVQFIFDSALTAMKPEHASYARQSFPPGRPILEGAVDLMSRIHIDFRYDTTVTDATTPVDRVFEIRSGVCQDLAHVGIACLRSLSLPARYVSGYLLTKPPPGKPRLLGADASHAWFSVWAPPFGWVDLDPTNNVATGQDHIAVAWGRDYTDVAPINGIVSGGGDHIVEVGVDVVPLDCSPAP